MDISPATLKAALIDSDAVFNNSHDAIIAMDSASTIVFTNDAALAMFGYAAAADLIGTRIEGLMNERHALRHAGFVARHLQGDSTPMMNNLRRIRAKRASGELFPIDINVFHIDIKKTRYYFGFIRDMSAVEEKEAQLKSIAYFDVTTELPNANSFRDFLIYLYQEDMKDDYVIAVIGVHNMKNINATYGFEVGDAVIQVVGRRLKSAMRDAAFFGRMVGNQFVAAHRLQPERTVDGHLAEIRDRAAEVGDAPIKIGDVQVRAHFTIGAITIPKLAETADLVTKHAEIAYGDAKRIAPQNVHHLSQSRLDALSFSASLTHKLVDAIRNEEFHLVLQPKVDIGASRVTGGEALLRWRRPTGEPIGPDVFVPAAENAGLIADIGRFVFIESCALLRRGATRSLGPLKIAINASPHQLADPRFIDFVEATFADSGVDPASAEFEVTETAVAAFPERVVAGLNRLRAMGASVALDDFGTGHSSLTMLHDLPIDRVKLDRAFMANLGQSVRFEKLVENSVRMMRDMGYAVTVEGVETRDVHDFLLALGVDEAQGYFYARPLSPDAFWDFELAI